MRQPDGASNPVDVHVGLRVRLRRKQLGLSQERLAEGLGLTFQQVQKYERGTNRISASKLFEISRILEVPIAYFFEGIDGATHPGTDRYTQAYNNVIEQMLAEPNGQELAEAFLSIRRRSIKKQLAHLIREIAAANDSEPSAAPETEAAE